MREEIKSRIKTAIKPYFRALPARLKGITYDIYNSKSFPKILGKIGEKTIFNGWGMTTQHQLPWYEGIGNEFFLEANTDIKTNFEFSGGIGVTLDNIDTLLWRHWVVSYAVRHALEFTQKTNLELVECGVADGISAFFELKELKGQLNLGRIDNFRLHLYDSWTPLRSLELSQKEKNRVGNYKDNDLDRVNKNLFEFADNVIFHQGCIPESLTIPPAAPESIVYLHIDLDSSMPTNAALEFFYPRIARGGVILFNDYGWKAYYEIKKVVDKFFIDKPGILMPLPTGQSIYYR